MLQAVHPVDLQAPPVRPKEDPTIAKSNFKTVETVTKVGHQNKPLGDWDVVVLEDAKKFQIEQTADKLRRKEHQQLMS